MMHLGGTQQKPSKWIRQRLPWEERPRKSSKEAVQAMVDKKGFRERELLEEGSRMRRQTIGRTKLILGAGDTKLDRRETRTSCPDKGFRQNANQEMAKLQR